MVFNRLFESRANAFQSVWAAGESIEFGTLAGTSITSENILQVNAVFSSVSLIADTISTLPIDVFIRRDGARFPFRPAPAWIQQPDVDFPSKEGFYSAVITSLLLDGNAFIRIFANSKGEIVNLVVLNPTNVEVIRNGLGRLMFKVKGEDAPLTSDEIVFIPDLVRPGHIRGVSRVDALKENFGLALALEKFASTFFGQGTNLAGVIEYPGQLNQEQADNLSNSFDNRHKGWRRGHKTGVLSGGATFKPTQTDPEKATLNSSRDQAVMDVARAFNVPPHLLAVPGSQSYASIEESNLAFVTHTLRPIAAKIENALSPLMNRYPGGETAFIRFNFDALLRANVAARSSAYSVGLQAGWLSVNDVRRFEDMSPIDDPAAYSVRVPLANVEINSAGLRAESERVKMAQQLIVVGFDPAEVLASLGLPEIMHTGLPSTQLQAVAQIDPAAPTTVYEVE